ncbi:NAD-binding protein of Kef-type K+ transporter [Streptomyces badius]
MGPGDAVDGRVFHVKLPGRDAMARQADELVLPTRVMLPRRVTVGPARQVAKRLLMALLVLAATVLIVSLDRSGYNDNADGEVDLLDAIYYATVTLSTTGYGDITPATGHD